MDILKLASAYLITAEDCLSKVDSIPEMITVVESTACSALSWFCKYLVAKNGFDSNLMRPDIALEHVKDEYASCTWYQTLSTDYLHIWEERNFEKRTMDDIKRFISAVGAGIDSQQNDSGSPLALIQEILDEFKLNVDPDAVVRLLPMQFESLDRDQQIKAVKFALSLL